MTLSNGDTASSDVLDRRTIPPSSSPATEESVFPAPPIAPRVSNAELAHELGEIIFLLLRVGTLLACAGAAAFRVREAMQRTALSFGAKRSEFVVTADSITASIFDGGEFRTQVVRLPPIGVDMNLLCRIEMLTRALLAASTKESVAAIHQQLDVLQAAPRLYPRWLTVPSLGAACAAFCAAGHGTPLQIACAFVGAALGHSFRLALLARRVPLVSIVVCCAFVSCSATELLAWPLSHLSEAMPAAPRAGIATLASVLYLIPGVPLVTSLLDLLHLDFTAALSRAANAAVLVGSIAVGMFGFFAVAKVFPW